MAESLWDGGPVLKQHPDVFPMGTDSILLADFSRPGSRVVDLGCGSGILSILLLSRHPGLQLTAVDISPAACELCRDNLACNNLSASVLQGDLRNPRELFPAGSFDAAVSNPPYFAAGSGKTGAFEEARSEFSLSLDEFSSAAKWSLRWGGRLFLVYRPERMCDLLLSLRRHALEPKRIRPVHDRPGTAVSLLLLEARHGGKPGMIWEPDLYIHNSDGSESDEIRQIYRRKDSL